MRRKDVFDWLDVAAGATALGLECAAVIGLRLSGAATGGRKAADEAWRMYSEKVIALAELQTLFLTGALGARPSGAAKRTLRHYRRKVASNRRRLSRS